MSRSVAPFVVLLITCATLTRGDDAFTTLFPDDDDDDGDYIDNRIDSTPTYVSPLERFLQTVVNPFRIFNRPDNDVQDNLRRLILSFPNPLQNALLPRQRSGKQGFGDPLNRFREGVSAIYPGTLWCGTGDVALSDDAVGLFRITDTCCKEHDACSISIPAGRDVFGLQNNGIFTRSLCSCDGAFYRCLKNARTLVSAKVGITYFNILRPQCFKKEYPIKSCKKHASPYPNDRCLIYDLDVYGNKTWQWFDNPEF